MTPPPPGRQPSSHRLTPPGRMVFQNYKVAVLLLASSIRFMGGYSLMIYVPTYFARAYPDENDIYSLGNAAVLVLGGKPPYQSHTIISRGA
jgi:hypothetical protein